MGRRLCNNPLRSGFQPFFSTSVGWRGSPVRILGLDSSLMRPLLLGSFWHWTSLLWPYPLLVGVWTQFWQISTGFGLVCIVRFDLHLSRDSSAIVLFVDSFQQFCTALPRSALLLRCWGAVFSCGLSIWIYYLLV